MEDVMLLHATRDLGGFAPVQRAERVGHYKYFTRSVNGHVDALRSLACSNQEWRRRVLDHYERRRPVRYV